MALVTKNDVTQIFAIQAPAIDLPPTFSNYSRGWDAARSNNGKPTIKQFNYIQQRTDQNVLWIHQNGGALPYDPLTEYAENSTVIKDGVLQQWKSGVWVKVTTWANVENKPTTVSEYGITDTYTKIESDNTFIKDSMLGIPMGVAELDASGLLYRSNLPLATTTTIGASRLVNDLTSGGNDKVLTAEMGKVLNNQSFGINQTWQNVTASRALTTTYTNSTSKTITVIAVCQSGSVWSTFAGSVDGVLIVSSTAIFAGGASLYTEIIFHVPPGATYSVTNPSNSGTVGNINKWMELR